MLVDDEKTMIDRSDKKFMVEIPKYLDFFDGDLVFFILAMILILWPFVLIILMEPIIVSSFGSKAFIILVIFGAIYMIPAVAIFGSFYPREFGHRIINKIQSYPIRKWILKNVKCPNCFGKLDRFEPIWSKPVKWKDLNFTSGIFSDYYYHCGSCKAKYRLDPVKKRFWKLVDVKSPR